MKLLILFFVFLSILGCSPKKGVYWCGDHACINKKEREAYFKETMIVEFREIDKKDKKSLSEIEQIKKEFKAKQKKIKFAEKQKLKKEKKLAKISKQEKKKKDKGR